MSFIPLFRQNARIIHLDMTDEEDLEFEGEELIDWRGVGITSLDMAIERLSNCAHITTLTTRLADPLNLDFIATSFPHLETLHCLETEPFRGSLTQLTHLQNLHMDSWGEPLFGRPPGYIYTMPQWLPLPSRETLTELNLKCNPTLDISFVDIP